MRALFLSDLAIQDSYLIKDEHLHHLVNVVRIEAQENVLLLNGEGLKVVTQVDEVTKKFLKLIKLSSSVEERSYTLDLALGMPKRDALELSLKQATELGFRKIYLVRSEFSQMKYPEEERMKKLLISALEQSNGAFLPEIAETSWEGIPYSFYESCIVFDSRPNEHSIGSIAQKNLLIIGPEGGFSPAEHEYFDKVKNLKTVNLPTPILRTPTAVATGAGIVIGGLLK